MKQNIMITTEYLKQLSRPEEAITESVWREIRKEIADLAEADDKFNKIIQTRINRVAPKLGFLWKNQKDDKISVILTKSLGDIRDRKFVGDWWKKGIVLTAINLTELTEDQYERLTAETDTLGSNNKIPYNLIRSARNSINKELTSALDKINTENFEELYTEFLKTFVVSIGELGNFNTKNMKRYLTVFFKRFKNSETYAEIAGSLEINQGLVNSILNKFDDEFKALFIDADGNYDESKFVSFVKKWEQFYNTIFEVITPSFNSTTEKLEERNNKLKGMMEFQNYFIGNELADYIE